MRDLDSLFAYVFNPDTSAPISTIAIDTSVTMGTVRPDSSQYVLALRPSSVISAA